jgi:hypothetical protein
MWILHFLPDSFLIYVINAICLVGIAATVFGFLLGFIPFISRWKLPLQIIGLIFLIGGVYFKGGYSVEAEWRARVKEMEAKVKVAEAKAKKANSHVQTKVITKIVKIHDKADKAKESIRRNKEAINKECKLSEDAISAYNFSITKTKPQETK